MESWWRRSRRLFEFDTLGRRLVKKHGLHSNLLSLGWRFLFELGLFTPLDFATGFKYGFVLLLGSLFLHVGSHQGSNFGIGHDGAQGGRLRSNRASRLLGERVDWSAVSHSRDALAPWTCNCFFLLSLYQKNDLSLACLDADVADLLWTVSLVVVLSLATCNLRKRSFVSLTLTLLSITEIIELYGHFKVVATTTTAASNCSYANSVLY